MKYLKLILSINIIFVIACNKSNISFMQSKKEALLKKNTNKDLNIYNNKEEKIINIPLDINDKFQFIELEDNKYMLLLPNYYESAFTKPIENIYLSNFRKTVRTNRRVTRTSMSKAKKFTNIAQKVALKTGALSKKSKYITKIKLINIDTITHNFFIKNFIGYNSKDLKSKDKILNINFSRMPRPQISYKRLLIKFDPSCLLNNLNDLTVDSKRNNNIFPKIKLEAWAKIHFCYDPQIHLKNEAVIINKKNKNFLNKIMHNAIKIKKHYKKREYIVFEKLLKKYKYKGINQGKSGFIFHGKNNDDLLTFKEIDELRNSGFNAEGICWGLISKPSIFKSPRRIIVINKNKGLGLVDFVHKITIQTSKNDNYIYYSEYSDLATK